MTKPLDFPRPGSGLAPPMVIEEAAATACKLTLTGGPDSVSLARNYPGGERGPLFQTDVSRSRTCITKMSGKNFVLRSYYDTPYLAHP